jgi:hypothetical protein
MWLGAANVCSGGTPMQTFQGIRVAAMSFPPGLCSREDDDAAFASSTTYGCDPDYPWLAAFDIPADYDWAAAYHD